MKGASTLRNVTIAWGVITLVVWISAVMQFGAGTTTTLSCDRGSGTCRLSGGSRASLPPLADLASAEVASDREHDVGTAHHVVLVGRDGAKHPLSTTSSVDASSVAEVRAAVAAFNAFVADASVPRLVVSVTVHASTAEHVRTIGIAAAALVMLVILVIMTLRSRRQSTDDAPVR
jgi:hypothetical protein